MEEIIKIVATRCQILRLKCTKSFVGWGSAPALRSPRPTSWILGGLVLRGRGRDESRKEGKVRTRRGRKGKRGEREGRRGERERGRRGREGMRRGWVGPQAKAWPHQNYFPGAGAAYIPTFI